MAQAAQELQSLVGAAKYLERHPNALPLGIECLDALLPDGGLPRGQVTEVAVHSPAQATSLGLWACRAAQREAKARASTAWCAFVDPSQSLFAPGVIAAGVEPSQLLVIYPPVEAVDRVAVKLAEAQVFSVVVIDLVYAAWLDANLSLDSAPALSRWEKIVRRLSVAIQGTASQIILLTDLSTRRALPLPVALRLELQRQTSERLKLTVAKDKYGRTGRPISLESNVFELNSMLSKGANDIGQPRTNLGEARAAIAAAGDVKKCSLRPLAAVAAVGALGTSALGTSALGVVGR
jgi:recombination protein RecA